MDSLLVTILCGVPFIGAIILYQNRRDKKRVEALCKSPSFARRKKRAPLDVNLSVAMSSHLKDELVRVSENQQSKYVRASLRLALPILKAHPSLVDILDEE